MEATDFCNGAKASQPNPEDHFTAYRQ